MFFLKKLISPLFYPLSLCTEILLIGVIGLWISRKQKTWKAVVSLGVVLLIAFGYGALSDDLLRPLEYRYPPLKNVPEDFNAKWVVVLGGGHVSDPRLPVTSQIAEASLARLVEGIRLYKSLPGSKLILSGGSGFDPVPNALIMAEVAMAIGVKKEEIVLETVSKDTKDEARLVQELVGNDKFILVTSAYHMPRSVAIFEKLGMEPLPAPTGHWVREGQKKGPGVFFPSAFSLYKAQRAFHEYLGLAWAKIRGQI